MSYSIPKNSARIKEQSFLQFLVQSQSQDAWVIRLVLSKKAGFKIHSKSEMHLNAMYT